MAINLADMAFAQWQAAEEKARQKEISKARTYYEGEQLLKITDRMRALLGLASTDEVDLRLNIIRVITRAVTERMAVSGFESTDTALSTWAWNTWQRNRFDVKQDSLHDDAVNDGEAFVIVDWPEGSEFARWIPHPRYVAGEQSGDEFGCKIIYENDDVNQPVKFASKRWREVMSDGKARLRLTLYYPERIEKYASVVGESLWMPTQDEGDTSWPVAWVDSASKPLGVPVFHFANIDARPEAKDAWGTQDGLNQFFIDLMANNRLAAFRIFKAFGFIPTTDGQQLKPDRSNALRIEPGMIVGTNKAPTEAGFDAIEGTDITPMLAAIEKLITLAASVTDTPVARFQFTGAVAAAETQKQYNEALLAKIRKRQMRFGDSYEDCLAMSRKLSETFGGGTVSDAKLETQWERAETRTIGDRAQESSAKKASGIPMEQIWSEVWGYSQERIDAMKLMDSFVRTQEIQKAAMGLNRGG